MSDGPKSTIVFDGDSTGAVAALHAVDVEAKRAAASLQGAGSAIKGVGEGENIEKTTARVKSLREAIIRNGDAVVAQAKAYGEVEKALQKIDQKGQKVELFTNQLDYLRSAENMLSAVQQKQKAIAEAERSAVAENAHWNALKLQKLSEVKASELAAARASADAENQALVAARATAAFKVQALNDQLKGIKALAAESEKVAAAERSATTAFKLQSLNDQIKARKAAELAAINEVSAAKERAARKEDAALSSYLTRIRNSAVELQAAGKLPSERAAIYGKEFGLPSAEVAKQVTYLQSLENQLAKTGGRYNEMGLTAKGTAAALRQVPAQFTDIIVSLQGGQAPLTVLLQQGGQLKDVFGGVGNAAKAMGGYVAGLINPFTVAATAIATIGYAYVKGSAESEAYIKALINTGNAAGVTAGQLESMAQSVSANTGGTIGAAAQALAALAGSAGIASAQFETIAAVAVQMEKVTGVAVADTVKQFADLGKDPVKASLKLTESTRYLTAEVYEQIKALVNQGRTLEAGAVAQRAYAEAMQSRLPALSDNLGIIQKAWKGIVKEAADGWDAMLGIGREQTAQGQLDRFRDQLSNARNTGATDSELQAIQTKVTYFERMVASQKSAAFYQSERIKKEESSIALAEIADKYTSRKVLMERELSTLATKYEGSKKSLEDLENYEKAAAEVRERYKEKAASKTKVGDEFASQREAMKEWEKAMVQADAAYSKATAKADGLSESEKQLRDYLQSSAAVIAEKLVPGTNALVKARFDEAIAAEKSTAFAKAQSEYMEKLGNAGAKETASLEARVQKQAQHNAEIGKTAEQIEAIRRVSEDAATAELEGQEKAITALLEKNEALLDYGDSQALLSGQAKEIYELELKSLREQIRLRKQLAKGYTEGEQKEAAANAAKASAAEWKRGWEETDRLARDVFTTWATDGSNAAQKIGDTLKKALLSAIYEATIKPIALQLYTSFTGGGGGAAGAVQGASNALSGGSSLVSGLSSLFSPSGALGGVGSAMTSFSNAALASAQSLVGITGTQAQMAASLTNAGYYGTSATAGSIGSAVGAIAPYAIAALVAKELMSYKVEATGSAIVANLGGGVTNVANRNDYRQTGGLFGGGTTNNSDWTAASADLTAYIDSQVKMVTESARAYGTALGLPVDNLDDFKKQIEVSLTGLNADQAKEAINKAISGFGDDLVSANFGAALDGLKQGSETASDTVVRLGTDLTGVNAVFASVGRSLLDMSVAGAATASSMVTAAGGLANFQAQVTAMYSQLDAARQAFADANRNAYELQAQAESDAKGFASDSGGGGGGGGNDALAEAIEYLAGASLSIRQWLDKLNSTDAGGLSADAQRTSAWASLQTQLTLARGGDRDALSGITGYADSYIDTINKTSKTEAEARLAIGKVRGQLAALPGQVSPEQFIVDAINANGGGAGAVATAVKSLGSKLTAELTVSARSEIVKMIEFVVDTDRLPNDLKQLALASADTMTKTVSFITGSKLSEENKQIALSTESLLTKTISYGLGQDIPDEYKKLALKTSDSISKTISYVARNMLDPKQTEIALMADNSIVKTIETAAKFLNADALKVAYSQSEVIRKMLEVSGGVLTDDQATLLDNISQYNKTINLFVAMDGTALDSAKDYIKRTLGTLDIEAVITGLPTTDDTGGLIPGQDVHKLLGGYINDLASDGLIDGADVGLIVGIVKRFGGTMADIAKATGWSLQQVIDFGAAWGIPEFAVGTDYIPRDMLAKVHKGEQIVPAAYNPHANGTAPGGASQTVLVEEIRALRTDNQAQALALVQLQKRMNKLLERWDGNGMPETRVVTA